MSPYLNVFCECIVGAFFWSRKTFADIKYLPCLAKSIKKCDFAQIVSKIIFIMCLLLIYFGLIETVIKSLKKNETVMIFKFDNLPQNIASV